MKTELIIPNFDNDGSDNSETITATIKSMCGLYGGCTVFAANGYWVNDTGRLYADEVSVIIAAVTEGDTKSAELEALARDVLKATDQEAVFLSVGGKAKIIE